MNKGNSIYNLLVVNSSLHSILFQIRALSYTSNPIIAKNNNVDTNNSNRSMNVNLFFIVKIFLQR